MKNCTLTQISENGEKLFKFFENFDSEKDKKPAEIKTLQKETEKLLRKILVKADGEKIKKCSIFPKYTCYKINDYNRNYYVEKECLYIFVKRDKKNGLTDINVIETEQIFEDIEKYGAKYIAKIEKKIEILRKFFANYDGEGEIPEKIQDVQEEIENKLEELDRIYYTDCAGASGSHYPYSWYTTDMDEPYELDYCTKYGKNGLEDVIFE